MSQHNKYKKNINKVIFVEWISSIGIFITCFLFLFYRIEKMNDAMSEIVKVQTERNDKFNDRTDKLYEMFIDLIRESKNNKEIK